MFPGHAFRLLWIVWLLQYCQGGETPVTQMLVFKDLPSGGKAHLPLNLVIRNNFEVSVKFIFDANILQECV